MIIQPNVSAVIDISSYASAATPAAARGDPPNGDSVAISPAAKDSLQAKEKAQENDGIREALVQQMKKRLESNPYPAGPVAEIIAEKIINGWGLIGQLHT